MLNFFIWFYALSNTVEMRSFCSGQWSFETWCLPNDKTENSCGSNVLHLFLEIPKNTINSIDTPDKPYRGTLANWFYIWLLNARRRLCRVVFCLFCHSLKSVTSSFSILSSELVLAFFSIFFCLNLFLCCYYFFRDWWLNQIFLLFFDSFAVTHNLNGFS